MKIESLQNKKVKEWTKLQEKKYRDEMGLFLIEGDHLILEAKKKKLVVTLIGLESYEKKEELDYIVTPNVMKKLTSQVTPSNVIAICKKIESKLPFGNILLLDGIQDPGNLGTIIRSAVAFSYDTIILSEDCVDYYNEKVIRSTEGMFFHNNLIKGNLKEEIKHLKEKGYKIYGTNVKNGQNLKEISFETKKAIVIGREGSGIKEDLISYFDENIYIPMNRECESLNAAMSASIIMYESCD